MRILVTGAGGYIGRHLVPRLRTEGHEIVALVRSGEVPYDAEVWYADLGNLEHMHRHKFRTPPDTVIHLAGRVDINLLPNPKGAHLPPVPGPCDIGALYRDNVLATANVLDYCLRAGVKHLIFASTQAVYGFQEHDCRGDIMTNPLEHYAASKLAAENLLRIQRPGGPAIDILRLPGVYGGERKNGLVYRMCKDALTKQEITLDIPYPLPMTVMYIEDVIGGFLAAAVSRSPSQLRILEVTDSEMCDPELLLEEVEQTAILHCAIWPRVLRNEVQHPVTSLPDTGLRGELGWIPKPRKERLAQVLEEIRRE